MFKFSFVNVILMCFTFYEINIIPHYIYLSIKYMSILYLFVVYFKTIKINKHVFFLCLLYSGIVFFTSFFNHMEISSVIASLFYGIQIIDIFLISAFFVGKYGLTKFVNILLFYFLFILLFTDLLMLLIHYDFNNPSENYLIGNKFVVSYVHCFASSLLILKHNCENKKTFFKDKNKLVLNKSNILEYVFIIVSIFISLKVTCSTGVIINLFLLVLSVLPMYLKVRISDRKFIIIGFIIINFLLFGTYSILNTAFFENFIYKILGKSVTWTGRLKIWDEVFTLINNKPLFGYGYYNNVIGQLLGFGNAQNGVLKILIDSGFFGLLAYSLICLQSFKCTFNLKIKEIIFPLFSFFYAMMLASSVEINLTHMIVFLSMGIMNSVNINAKKIERMYSNENCNNINAESI